MMLDFNRMSGDAKNARLSTKFRAGSMKDLASVRYAKKKTKTHMPRLSN